MADRLLSPGARLAIDGGAPVRRNPFPSRRSIPWSVIKVEGEAAALKVVSSRLWGSRGGGGRVQAFEERFARFEDASAGPAVTSGTAALDVALRACGVGIGDEVIVPLYTFVATASASLMRGTIPGFVDSNAATYCIDHTQIEPPITPHARAISAVQVAGALDSE